MKTIEGPGKFLVDNGILFELNRQILHPLGMQLDLAFDQEGALQAVALIDHRDSEVPIYFQPAEYEEGRSKYERYMADHGRANIQKRHRIGMVTQSGSHVPGSARG